MRPRARQLLLLTGGCVVLGAGVALLLTADLGSDGFSTLVNGVSISTGVPFWVANLLVSLAFLGVAATRRVLPGIGTVVQVVVVGGVASLLLDLLRTPATWQGQALMLAGALPVIAVGIATYLGSRTGAGPAEAAGLAWDPPVPFRWSYSAVQGGGALGGWLLGATLGPGTLVVVVLLGPLVEVTSRLLRLDVHQNSPRPPGPVTRGRSRPLPLLGVTGFEDLLAANRRYAENFTLTGFDGFAHAGVAIVTCMDSRLDPLSMVGLQPGDAKILRNPGGRVTDAALVALVLGVSLLNVSRILVVQHTRCAMAMASEAELQARVGERLQQDASWLTIGAIPDQHQALRADVRRVRSHPLVPTGIAVAGFLYDVDTGLLGDPVT